MRVKKITEVLGAKVYTNGGDYFGVIEEANLHENRIDGWKIKVDPSIVSLIGAKGVIIPHQFVEAMSDIVLINKSALPSPESNLEDIPEELI